MDVVYIDEVFLLNLLLDYLLLLAAARLRGSALRRWRFLLGAAMGGLYAALCVLPGLSWLSSPAVKLAVSGFLALAAYGGAPGLWKSWACFLALSAAFGGAVYAVSLLAGQTPGSGGLLPVSGKVLLLSFGACYAAVRLLFGRFLEKRRRCIVPVEAVLGSRRAGFSALRDTGNGLFDPVTGLHVLIADPSALSPLFSPPLPEEPNPAALLLLLSGRGDLSGRLRLVPYTAVGTERGLLLCLRPDGLTVGGERAEMLLGLSPTPIGDNGDYSGIV